MSADEPKVTIRITISPDEDLTVPLGEAVTLESQGLIVAASDVDYHETIRLALAEQERVKNERAAQELLDRARRERNQAIALAEWPSVLASLRQPLASIAARHSPDSDTDPDCLHCLVDTGDDYYGPAHRSWPCPDAADILAYSYIPQTRRVL